MTDYTTIRVTTDAKQAADESKRENETWNEYIRRCTENPPETTEYVAVEDISLSIEATERTRLAEEIAQEVRNG